MRLYRPSYLRKSFILLGRNKLVRRVWEICRRFTFAEGRPAAFLITKVPKEITKEDAVRAFMPYLKLRAYTNRQ